MHMQIGCHAGSAMTQLGTEPASQGTPRLAADRKTKMCSIFDIDDRMCLQRCIWEANRRHEGDLGQ